ncbi:MAG: hypothetical protein EXQ85_05040 [Alphaproteobacteria bacterium]|nr:hypothetical protein [Alphaproteobacteria bacterium]
MAAVALIGVLAGCRAEGPVSDPVGRAASWFDYAAGRDIERACALGTPDRLRFVYNAVYTEHVRTYDLTVGPDGASLLARAFSGTLGRVSGPEIFPDFAGRQAPAGLTQFEADQLFTAARLEGLGARPPVGSYLRSDAYYWVVAACRAGAFAFTAFTGPGGRLESLAFRPLLLAKDRTGVAVPVQRPVDSDRTTDFGRIYKPVNAEADDRGRFDGGPRFMFEVRLDGLR